MKKQILFICLGNICRSPAAEAVCLNKLEKKGWSANYEIDSAGTGSWHVGKLADARMRKAASKRGIDITSRARVINLNDFQKYDLILTMDQSNLDDVNALAMQVSGEIKASIRPLLEYATDTNIIEVPDPYYGGENGFDQVLDLLDNAIDGLLASLNSQV